MDKHQVPKFRWAALALLVGVSFPGQAFELLSEGAMDSVSAVSVANSEDIINVAGATAAGLRVEGGSGYYEELPLADRTQLEGYATEDQSEELSRTLTLEVEAWADSLRQSTAASFEIGYVDQLPVTEAQPDLEVDVFDSIRPDDDTLVVRPGSDTVFQIGRLEQVFELLDSGVNTISFSLRRQIESVSTVNARPDDDSAYMGSGFITNLVSDSRIRFSDER